MEYISIAMLVIDMVALMITINAAKDILFYKYELNDLMEELEKLMIKIKEEK